MAGKVSDGGDTCKYSGSGGLVNTPSPRTLRLGGKEEWRNNSTLQTGVLEERCDRDKWR